MANQVPPVIEEPRASLFSNLTAIIGLIILIVIVIWGLVHLAGLSQGWLSGLFGGGGSKVTVTAPAQVTANQPFNVSWKYSTDEKGNYAFLYQCKSGLTFKSDSRRIPCGTAFTVGPTTTLTITPTLEQIASTSVPITVVFLPSATSSPHVQGSATVVVRSTALAQSDPQTQPANQVPTPVAQTPVATTPEPEPTITSSEQTYTSAATPTNLTVRIIAIGVIDRSTGMFVNRSPMYVDDIAAAQFDISNTGGSTSGTYYFSSNLPTATGYVYNSPAQSPLGSGDHVVNTLRWTSSAQYGTFTVQVTGGGDSNTSDNFASATIGATGVQPNYNGYQYPPQQQYYYPQQYAY